MIKLKKHTQDERMNGICRVCTLNTKQIKKCYGYGMIGDRACDSRHIPDYQDGDKFILCKYIEQKKFEW